MAIRGLSMFKKWRINRLKAKIARLSGELNTIHNVLPTLDYVDERLITDLFDKTHKLNLYKEKLKNLEVELGKIL